MAEAKGGSSRGGLRLLVVMLVLLLAGFASLLRYAYKSPDVGKKVNLDDVYAFAQVGGVVSVKFLDEDSQVIGRCQAMPGSPQGGATTGSGQLSDPRLSGGPVRGTSACPKDGRFRAAYPASDVATQQLIEQMLRSGASVEVDKQSTKAVGKLLATFVFPLAMLANIFGIIFLYRGADSSMTDIIGFGSIAKNRQRKRHAAGTGVSFADVAGAEEAVVELREVVDYLSDPSKFEAFGASVPKGVLLFGPPGCGKTLLARAVAGETGVAFFSVSGAEFVESLVGVGAARVRDLFRQVRELAPAIIFIDEIDAVGRKREGEGVTGGEREQTVNQLLVEIDGFEASSGMVVMGATNRPDILDQALLRPGRFDRHITLQPPDVHGRVEILELHSQGKPLAEDVDFDLLARRTPGFTGADLANVINEAALLAMRKGEGANVHTEHLLEAIERVLHGPQRRGRIMTKEERHRIAIHESGHAVVAAAVTPDTEVQRISIVARGRGLGQSLMAADSERVLLTRSEMCAELIVAMSGVATEKLFLGESSTTADADLEKANEVARQMVGLYGMSEAIRGLRVLSSRYDGFLSVETSVVSSVAPGTLEAFDREVQQLIDEAELRATEILVAYRGDVESMAARLQEEETLEGPALEQLLAVVRNKVTAAGGISSSLHTTNGNSKTGPATKATRGLGSAQSARKG